MTNDQSQTHNTEPKTLNSELQTISVDFTPYKTNLTPKYLKLRSTKYQPPNPRLIRSFIPGTIKKIYIKEKDLVRPGDKLLVLEAMKMRNDIISTISARIKKIHVKLEQTVSNKQLLIELE